MEEDDDDFLFYGTSFPDIENEVELRKKAARELEVRDEKGRQRFHGAFTGGFSAGYFNTVGTKEGWTPSTFISSRNKTADRIQQNPEDFMDEEDLGEFGIATRKIHTANKFKDSSDLEVKKRKFNELDSIIPGEAPLKQIVEPVRDSIGIEILKKLGWRQGQGIGPRVKKQGKNTKVYGCSLPGDSLPEEDDPFALSYTFAPEDTIEIIFQPKDNYFGLGYTGLSKQSVLSARFDENNPTSTKSFLKKDKRKLTISGQAFGVGAFEDDDDDIYSKDDMSQYDFTDFDKESDQSFSKFGTKALLKLPSGGILGGFCLTSKPSLSKKYYPPPELPADFMPKFTSLFTQQPSLARNQYSSQHNMTAQERSYLLGEKKFQSIQLKMPTLPIKGNKEECREKSDAIKSSIDKKTFKPFCNDSAKQERYEEFLKLKSSGEIDKFVMPSSMTEWEKQQELEEFSRSALLFKPLSAALSSKFESRSHLSVEHEVMDAIEKAKKEKTLKSSSSVKKKLVGLRNRKTFDWYPSAILCKRFNVPNPYPNAPPSGVSATSQQSKSLFDHITVNIDELKHVDEKPKSSSVKEVMQNITQEIQENAIKDKELNSTEKAPTISVENLIDSDKKPSMDFFKDIFENTSSEEDTSPEEQTETSIIITQPSLVLQEKEKSITTELNPPSQESRVISKKIGFGVFANLDLDALNQKTAIKNETKTLTPEYEQSTQVSNSRPREESDMLQQKVEPMQQDIYGPELPPDYSEHSSTSNVKYSKKHKTKHKHHKHKSKKKKKKKSSHKSKSSDNYSSESDEDINPEVILQRFNKLRKKL